MTLKRHLKDDLGMYQLAGLLAYFTKTTQKKTSGIVGKFVDDTIATSDVHFEKEITLTEKKFDSISKT